MPHADRPAASAPPDRRRRKPPEGAAPAMVLALLILAALCAPLIANDRPLAATVDGRLVFPAFADLLGNGPGDRGTGDMDWSSPPAEVTVLARAPVPWSYRGIRLDDVLRPPDRHHLLGTDLLGRDLLARMIHGARVSLLLALGATLAAIVAGVILGATAALRGGVADGVTLRLIEVFSCFPPLIIALAFVTAGGRGGLWPVIGGIALNRWAPMARYVRGEILRLTGSELWDAARASGAGGARLVVRHLLPLLLGPMAVLVAFGAAHAILLEAGLSFVGFGVEPPVPSWGGMLAESRATLDAAWWPVLCPALGLLTILALLAAAADRAGAPGNAVSPVL